MKDIEDIIHNQKINEYVKELVDLNYSSQVEYDKTIVKLRKKYKINPNKPSLRKCYYQLLKKNEIKENLSFIHYSLKKKVRSNSGVSVITILTSPTPEYTNINGEKVQQSFSCGKSCAYCPNEPEININLKVNDINYDKKLLYVSTTDNIDIIRLLTYVIHNNIKYRVYTCSKFTDKSFIIELNDFPSTIQKNDMVLGNKIEQPRSYLSTEPAVLRANRDNFDPVIQIYDRTDALENCGHEVDKIEILVLGGTWDHYPLEYQREFIRDIYFSINTLKRRNVDVKLSLEEEIEFCQTSDKRIIGLTLETRPDCINLRQIKRIREFNVTRLQIGVQHIDDDILNKIERGCNLHDTITSNYLWKHNGGKIDWHLMPDLPGSSKEKDIDMFKKIFGVNSILEVSPNYFKYDLKHPELQADQLKIYPCSVVDWTKIKEWYDEGSYKPYSENEDDLIEVIIFIKKNVFPWIRINRIIRDIPNINIRGGNKNVNLHQKLLDRKEIISDDIRCREVKENTDNIEMAELVIREYNGKNSTEYFISYESPNKRILYGFLRLRINENNDDLIYKELNDCAFIRELHVYGKIIGHFEKKGSVQHMGFGKKLMKEAEKITKKRGIKKIAIISGVGVREYYEKIGYKLSKNYMITELSYDNIFFEYSLILLIVLLLINILYDLL